MEIGRIIEKSCYSCKHAIKRMGKPETEEYPAEPMTAECTASISLSEIEYDRLACDWKYAELAKICGGYTPESIQYWTGKGPKSCYNCIYSEKENGYPPSQDDPGWLDTADCTIDTNISNEEMDEYWENGDYETLAAKCGKYTPIIVLQCIVCGAPIYKPENEHEHWAKHNNPCCSKACEDIANKEIYNYEGGN